MKTNIWMVIDSRETAEQYILELIKNGEIYHLEDDANDITFDFGELNEIQAKQMNLQADLCFEFMEDPFDFILDNCPLFKNI